MMTTNISVQSQGRMLGALVLALLPLGLLGCGGTSEDGDTVYVGGVNLKSTVNKTGVYKLEVTGSNNDVTVSAGNKLARIDITGLNHDVWIQAGVEVERVDMSGAGNTLHVPRGFTSKISRSGSNNVVKEEG